MEGTSIFFGGAMVGFFICLFTVGSCQDHQITELKTALCGFYHCPEGSAPTFAYGAKCLCVAREAK